jgi:hypothetical protein
VKDFTSFAGSMPSMQPRFEFSHFRAASRIVPARQDFDRNVVGVMKALSESFGFAVLFLAAPSAAVCGFHPQSQRVEWRRASFDASLGACVFLAAVASKGGPFPDTNDYRRNFVTGTQVRGRCDREGRTT